MDSTLMKYKPGKLYLTDGGLETTLIFKNGYDLPCFAAFHLLKSDDGYDALRKYFIRYLEIAKKYSTGFVLESPTWRASRDWLIKIGYGENEVHEINKAAVKLLTDLKDEYSSVLDDIIISGCIGPRGDGYRVDDAMTVQEAANYHLEQAKALALAGVDMITAITMNYLEEAEGIVAAANSVNVPVIISFTVETDGKLPTGMSLKEAIETIEKRSQVPPVYYMINCAHPEHFEEVLRKNAADKWTGRIRGIRANASCKSHAELDNSTDLDRGNPRELGIAHRHLKEDLTQLNVFGGCCGTDEEHIDEIAKNIARYY